MKFAEFKKTWLFVLCALVVALATALPRVVAPWRNDIHLDETFHLESWKNRYRDDFQSPLALTRIEASPRFSPAVKAKVRQLYGSSQLLRRGQFIIADNPSPLFSLMGEVIREVTDSSLVALRMPAMAFSLGSLLLAYLIGCSIKDKLLGLWAVAMVGVGPVGQSLAGFGRPHAMAQFGLLAVIYAFVQQQKLRHRSPWRFLLVALFAQMCHWTVWAAVGPFVVAELLTRLCHRQGIPSILKQTWWYIAGTAGLVGVFEIVNFATGASGMLHWYGALVVSHFVLASPFAFLGRLFGEIGSAIGAVVYVGLACLGLWRLTQDREQSTALKYALWVAIAVSTLQLGFFCQGPRHVLIPSPLLLIPAAIGAAWLFRSGQVSAVVAAVLASGPGIWAIVAPEDEYVRLFKTELRFEDAARVLTRELGAGDQWFAWNYFWGNALYRFGPLPEPLLLSTDTELTAAVRGRRASMFVLTNASWLTRAPILREYGQKWEFQNGFLLLKFPALRQ